MKFLKSRLLLFLIMLNFLGMSSEIFAFSLTDPFNISQLGQEISGQLSAGVQALQAAVQGNIMTTVPDAGDTVAIKSVATGQFFKIQQDGSVYTNGTDVNDPACRFKVLRQDNFIGFESPLKLDAKGVPCKLQVNPDNLVVSFNNANFAGWEQFEMRPVSSGVWALRNNYLAEKNRIHGGDRGFIGALPTEGGKVRGTSGLIDNNVLHLQIVPVAASLGTGVTIQNANGQYLAVDGSGSIVMSGSPFYWGKEDGPGSPTPYRFFCSFNGKKMYLSAPQADDSRPNLKADGTQELWSPFDRKLVLYTYLDLYIKDGQVLVKTLSPSNNIWTVGGASGSVSIVGTSAGKIEINYAWYGVEDGGAKNDATAQTVMAKLNDVINKYGFIVIPAKMNDFFGIDPFPGRVKTTAIALTVNGVRVSPDLRAPEGKDFIYPKEREGTAEAKKAFDEVKAGGLRYNTVIRITPSSDTSRNFWTHPDYHKQSGAHEIIIGPNNDSRQTNGAHLYILRKKDAPASKDIIQYGDTVEILACAYSGGDYKPSLYENPRMWTAVLPPNSRWKKQNGDIRFGDIAILPFDISNTSRFFTIGSPIGTTGNVSEGSDIYFAQGNFRVWVYGGNRWGGQYWETLVTDPAADNRVNDGCKLKLYTVQPNSAYQSILDAANVLIQKAATVPDKKSVEDLVENMYKTLLDRGSDAGGKAGWVNAALEQAAKGVDITQWLSDQFKASSEYKKKSVNYNTLLSIVSKQYPEKPLWTHGASRDIFSAEAKNQSTSPNPGDSQSGRSKNRDPNAAAPNDFAELLAGPATDARTKNGPQLFMMRKVDNPAYARAMNFGDKVEIISMAGGAGWGAVSGPYPDGRVWYANPDTRWEWTNFPDGAMHPAYGEILIVRPDSDYAKSQNRIFTLQSPAGKTGAISQSDEVYIVSQGEGPVLNGKRLWIHAGSRWGGGYGEVVIGDHRFNRDVEGGKFYLNEEVRTTQNAAIFDKVTTVLEASQAAAEKSAVEKKAKVDAAIASAKTTIGTSVFNYITDLGAFKGNFSENWKLTTPDKGSITFNAKTDRAIVVDFSTSMVGEKGYRVVIGRDNNTHSLIYKNNAMVLEIKGAHITKSEGDDYWVSINNGNVAFGNGRIVGENEIGLYQDPTPITGIFFIGLSGGWSNIKYTNIQIGIAVAEDSTKTPVTAQEELKAEGQSVVVAAEEAVGKALDEPGRVLPGGYSIQGTDMKRITMAERDGEKELWAVGTDGKLYYYDFKSISDDKWEEYEALDKDADGNVIKLPIKDVTLNKDGEMYLIADDNAVYRYNWEEEEGEEDEEEAEEKVTSAVTAKEAEEEKEAATSVAAAAGATEEEEADEEDEDEEGEESEEKETPKATEAGKETAAAVAEGEEDEEEASTKKAAAKKTARKKAKVKKAALKKAKRKRAKKMSRSTTRGKSDAMRQKKNALRK